MENILHGNYNDSLYDDRKFIHNNLICRFNTSNTNHFSVNWGNTNICMIFNFYGGGGFHTIWHACGISAYQNEYNVLKIFGDDSSTQIIKNCTKNFNSSTNTWTFSNLSSTYINGIIF